MKIAVVGTGYVGLISGVGLARVGHSVTCFDVRPEVIDRLRRGEATIYEPGLTERLAMLSETGLLKFALADAADVAENDVVLIAVGTPSKDGDIDLSFVHDAARLAGAAMAMAGHPMSVIVKSTVVPGTTSGLVRRTLNDILDDHGIAYGLGMNPEFLREGCAIADFENPDRLILGFENDLALTHLREMYSSFDCPKLEVSSATAELIKYANNYFLALQISASNEIANLAADIGGIDPVAVMDGVKLDRRWTGDWQSDERPHGIASYLLPGPGFGGSCFPKDVEALVALAGHRNIDFSLGQGILKVNRAQPATTVRNVVSNPEAFNGQRVLLLGLAFKPDTDDVRETPATGMIQELYALGAEVWAHDPIAMCHFDRAYGSEVGPVRYVDDWRASAVDADTVLLVTPWAEYRVALTDGSIEPRVILDPRRALSAATLSRNTRYGSIGVPAELEPVSARA